MKKYQRIEDGLPISGHTDPKYNAPYQEYPVMVMAGGKEMEAVFWACWQEIKDADEDDEFIMEFDVDNVTHWKFM